MTAVGDRAKSPSFPNVAAVMKTLGPRGRVRPADVDRLAYAAVFDEDPAVRAAARYAIRAAALAAGIYPASIHDLYAARGRRKVPANFTVPAVNIRGLAYETARALWRAAQRLDAGAVIVEIAKSEIGYTDQRPDEYAVVMLAAALREGRRGPVFLQGDHVQVNAKNYAADAAKEMEAMRSLVREEIAAGFYNIDIDASTLVDLAQESLEAQQAANCSVTAEMTDFIRSIEPRGVTVSVGGEIGEVGGKNSTPEELHAYMNGYASALYRAGGPPGISKISVQTGTKHGGFIDEKGRPLADVKVDIECLGTLSRIAVEKYRLAGAVQHGASTLPEQFFHRFAEVGACEIHLATGFQNILYEDPAFPADLRDRIYAWCRESCAGERKPGQTDEQFLYETRKKGLGHFKREIWAIPEKNRRAIGRALEERFRFLLRQLNVGGTSRLIRRFVRPRPVPLEWSPPALAAVEIGRDEAGE